jgi:hypothetical protein
LERAEYGKFLIEKGEASAINLFNNQEYNEPYNKQTIEQVCGRI